MTDYSHQSLPKEKYINKSNKKLNVEKYICSWIKFTIVSVSSKHLRGKSFLVFKTDNWFWSFLHFQLRESLIEWKLSLWRRENLWPWEVNNPTKYSWNLVAKSREGIVGKDWVTRGRVYLKKLHRALLCDPGSMK